MTIPVPGFPPPPPGKTRLIIDRDDREKPTSVRETDARTALTRGLAEYLEQLGFDADGGRQFIFDRVFQTWAEPEDEAVYPRAVVYAEAAGDYDASRLTPGITERVQLPDGRFLISGMEYVLDMIVDAWATDPEARQSLTAMIEDAFVPVDFRNGLLLELPHYFNERGTYELMSGAYVDDALAAQQRVRRTRFTVRGRVAVKHLIVRPEAKPRVKTSVSETEVIPPGSRLRF